MIATFENKMMAISTIQIVDILGFSRLPFVKVYQNFQVYTYTFLSRTEKSLFFNRFSFYLRTLVALSQQNQHQLRKVKIRVPVVHHQKRKELLRMDKLQKVTFLTRAQNAVNSLRMFL